MELSDGRQKGKECTENGQKEVMILMRTMMKILMNLLSRWKLQGLRKIGTIMYE